MGFASVVAQAVLKQSTIMPVGELVEALNKCQSMAAKAKLLEGKGKNSDETGLDLARKFLHEEMAKDQPEEVDDADL